MNEHDEFHRRVSLFRHVVRALVRQDVLLAVHDIREVVACVLPLSLGGHSESESDEPRHHHPVHDA